MTNTETSTKTAPGTLWALRALAAVGLGASVLLLHDYTRDAAPLCTSTGCDVVRTSSYAAILGIPTPVYGVVFFAAVLVLSALRSSGARRLLTAAAAAGGLAGAGFILIQAIELHAFCAYCVIVDVASLAIALLALALPPAEAWGRESWATFASVLLAGSALPFLLGLTTREAPRPARAAGATVPECIAQEQSPTALTITEFMDFQCPHCRAQHFALGQLVPQLSARVGRPIRVVRKHFPLPNHPQSKVAARAAICAEDQGMGELMTDLLFSTEDLSQAAIDASAAQLGMQTDAFHGCMSSPETAQRLAADLACGFAARVSGLPTLYIGEERFEGAQRDDTIVAAVRRAAAGGSVEARRP